MSSRVDRFDFFGVDVAGTISGSLSLAASFLRIGVPQPSAPIAETAAADTITIEQSPQGLASLLGKYDNDPSWEDFPAFLEQYRREIDEMNRE